MLPAGAYTEFSTEVGNINSDLLFARSAKNFELTPVKGVPERGEINVCITSRTFIKTYLLRGGRRQSIRGEKKIPR